ncbi:MAG: hypothetical protein SXQ77_03870 [Halobacteria archaeon]|nr:hypothetical protein [Halobacteria archaeon]
MPDHEPINEGREDESNYDPRELLEDADMDMSAMVNRTERAVGRQHSHSRSIFESVIYKTEGIYNIRDLILVSFGVGSMTSIAFLLGIGTIMSLGVTVELGAFVLALGFFSVLGIILFVLLLGFSMLFLKVRLLKT